MVELLEEGLALLISLALGISLFTFLHPSVASSIEDLTNRGGALLLDDLRELLKDHEGYSIQFLISKGVCGWYKNGVFTINLFNKSFSTEIGLGPYEFQIYRNCTLEFDGVGWRNVG